MNEISIVEKTRLFDFYGELLTGHQQEIYEAVVFNDMSLSEAAEAYHMTRHGIHDILKRCDKTLAGYEEKLHMVERYRKIKKEVRELLKTADEHTSAALHKILEDLDS